MSTEQAPTKERVRKVLEEYYRERGFDWEYVELFARLLRVTKTSSIARQAQSRMRATFPHFQRRATFFGDSGSLRMESVEEQSIAVAEMCRQVLVPPSPSKAIEADQTSGGEDAPTMALPNIDSIADRVLDALARIEPETRYEEQSWIGPTGRIAGTNEALRQALGASSSAVTFPGGSELCDLCIDDAGTRTWLEVKHSWTYMTYIRPAGPNKSRFKHLLGSDGHTALDDARSKLPALIGRPEVSVIGMLVVALDSVELPYPLADIDTLERLGGMHQQPWKRFSRPRWKSRAAGYSTIRVQPFLWLRPG